MSAEGQQIRIDQLERATIRLGEQVGGLNSALMSVTELQARQTVMDERQTTLERTVVPREEIQATAEELNERLQDYRRLVLRRVYTASVIILAVLASIGVVAANYLSAKQDANFKVCQGRNQAITSARDYFVAVQESSTNTVLRDAAGKALKTYVTSDCRGLQ